VLPCLSTHNNYAIIVHGFDGRQVGPTATRTTKKIAPSVMTMTMRMTRPGHRLFVDKKQIAATTTRYTPRSNRPGRGSPTLLQMAWTDPMQKLLGALLTGTKKETQSQQQQSANTADVQDSKKATTESGTVIRIASRSYNATTSKPSSREYTTRKVEVAALSSSSSSGARVTPFGLDGDYNHYRTVALKNTPDRALSLLTSDVLEALRANYPTYQTQIQPGDLGENIYITGIPFTFFQVGQRYQFQNPISEDDKDNNDKDGVGIVIEITERIEPCANLCKLPYINDPMLRPMDRIQRCQDFIQYLDRFDGFRGWYAKVIGEGGVLHPGAQISRLLEVEGDEENG
jgi:MOSC domain-containing protein YiiM